MGAAAYGMRTSHHCAEPPPAWRPSSLLLLHAVARTTPTVDTNPAAVEAASHVLVVVSSAVDEHPSGSEVRSRGPLCVEEM